MVGRVEADHGGTTARRCMRGWAVRRAELQTAERVRSTALCPVRAAPWAGPGRGCVAGKPVSVYLSERSFLSNINFKIHATGKRTAKIHEWSEGWPAVNSRGVRMRLPGGWEVLNWFAIFKHIFLSNYDSIFGSVWTYTLFRINATKWDIICIYFTYFSYLKRSTFGMYHFNILRIPIQHFGYVVSTFQHEVLNLFFRMLN